MQHPTKIHIGFLILVVTCLSIGAVIYQTLRSGDIYLNQWAAPISNGKMFQFLKEVFQHMHLPKWIIFSLPDALWMFSLTVLVLMIWDFKLNKKSMPWITIAIFIGVFYEFLQALNIVPGTFDFTDLLFILMGALLPISIIRLKTRTWRTN